TQTVTVTATVADALDPSETIDPINGGTVTFHIAGAGSDVTANVVNGVATTTFTIDASVPAGAYTITASYTPPSNPTHGFGPSSGNATLTITPAPTSTTLTSGNISTTYSAGSQSETLTADVTSSAGPVNEGT